MTDETLHDRIKDLAGRLTDAGRGVRAGLVADFAQLHGISTATVYRRLRALGASARKTRSDKGATRQDQGATDDLAAMLRVSVRKNGKQVMDSPTARAVLAQSGREFTVSNSRLAALLRDQLKDARCQTQPSAHTALRSLHPNHVHQLDPSLCLIYYLPGGGQAVIDEAEAYKNKPEAIGKVGNLRVWRYVLTDHYSSSIILRYYQAAGETQANLYDFLLYAWGQREARLTHGVPQILMWDLGSANTSSAVKHALAALQVRDIPHIKGNPRAKGQVEGAQNLVEKLFESRLKFEPAASIEQLNAWAEDWAHAYNAGCLPGYDSRLRRPGMATPVTRWGLWQTIRAEQLRLLPDEDTCRWLLRSKPQPVKVRGDMTVSFRHPGADGALRYRVGHIEHAYAGGRVQISPLVYGSGCRVLIMCEDQAGEQHTYDVEPIRHDDLSGFAADAPVIGAEHAAQKQTPVEAAGAEAVRRAYPGLSDEDIERARARQVVPFDGELDAMSHLKDATPPAYMRRRGTALNVPSEMIPSPLRLSPVAAAKRLRAALGKSRTNYHRLVSERWPDGIMEDDLTQLMAELGAPTTHHTGDCHAIPPGKSKIQAVS